MSRRIAKISTLHSVSPACDEITIPVGIARSFFLFQHTPIIEWRVKKPHTAVGIPVPVSFSYGKQFPMGPALCHNNTASALWHGKNALSLRGGEWAIESLPGFLQSTGTLTMTHAGGWRSNTLRSAPDTGAGVEEDGLYSNIAAPVRSGTRPAFRSSVELRAMW